MNLPEDAGAVLTGIARHAIAARLGISSAAPGRWMWLDEPGASFVTLTIDTQLRGCIGSLRAWRALGQDVAANAVQAAFADHRFAELGKDEYGQIAVEVSVLSVPEEMAVTSLAEAVCAVQPGLDGIVLSAQGRQATYLPQVWAQLPEPASFLLSLQNKAGLGKDCWDDPSLRLQRYQVTCFSESVS